MVLNRRVMANVYKYFKFKHWKENKKREQLSLGKIEFTYVSFTYNNILLYTDYVIKYSDKDNNQYTNSKKKKAKKDQKPNYKYILLIFIVTVIIYTLVIPSITSFILKLGLISQHNNQSLHTLIYVLNILFKDDSPNKFIFEYLCKEYNFLTILL